MAAPAPTASGDEPARSKIAPKEGRSATAEAVPIVEESSTQKGRGARKDERFSLTDAFGFDSSRAEGDRLCPA